MAISLRKVFDLNNENNFNIVEKLGHSKIKKPVSAAGCLFYRIKNGTHLQLLLIQYKTKNISKLDDLGGKVDIEDKQIINCIMRETEEETNNAITKHTVWKHFAEKDYLPYYTMHCKYYGLAIFVNDELDNKDFGDYEIADNIERTINWYDYSTVKNKLAERMKENNTLMDYFDKLEQNVNID